MADAASTILLRAGILGPQSLAAASALKQREGGTLGEALVRLGLVDEDRLVAVFQEALLVPVVLAADLARVPPAVIQAVPARMAAEFRVIPVDVDREGNLTLAMADPTDNRAVDAVAAHTGRFVMRAVAAPTAVRGALLTHYGVSLTKASSQPPQPVAAPAAPPRAARAAERRNTLPPSGKVVPVATLPPEQTSQTSGAVLQALARAVVGTPATGDGPRAPRRRNSQPLPVVPLEGEGKGRAPRRNSRKLPVAAPPAPLDRPAQEPAQELLAPVARLRAAADRDEVIAVLLDYAQRLAARVGLFVVQKGQLTCLDGRGPDHVVVAMKWFTIPVDTPSPFRDVLESRAPYHGRLLDTAESRAFRSALGSTEGELLLLPLLVGNKAVGVLYADEIKEDLQRLARELETLSREAGAAFARIILSKKK